MYRYKVILDRILLTTTPPISLLVSPTMRIRKNAKISTFFCTNTNVSNAVDECLLQKNLCQLNQSPWDIITFPSSSLHQFDDYEDCNDVNHAGNGSSIDPIGESERKITSSGDCAALEGENYSLVDPKNDHKEILGFEDGEMNIVGEEILLCDVRVEKGLQCGRVVKNGEMVCDHHIIELQNNAVWTTKKKSGPIQARSRQTKKRASTSPYEFYYYSGFGPSWGKKRGTAYNEPPKVASSDNYKIKETGLTNDDHEIWREEGKRFEPETSNVGPANMELSCNNDKQKDKRGKKRGRKPMKARSLKSLM